MNENYKILDMINSPADLKGLTKNEILSLSAELRNFIIESVCKHKCSRSCWKSGFKIYC